MNHGIKAVVYPVTDVAKAKQVFTALLGVEPHTDQPYYVGYQVNGVEIGLNPAGAQQGMTVPLPLYDVDDVPAAVQALAAAGAQVLQQPTDVGGGTIMATVADADGNRIGLRKAWQ